jgi:hypothetical protein
MGNRLIPSQIAEECLWIARARDLAEILFEADFATTW